MKGPTVSHEPPLLHVFTINIEYIARGSVTAPFARAMMRKRRKLLNSLDISISKGGSM
jgi:hypothetical protein